ncbi:hypothetical protein FO519_010159, partial [Halicephalobus sp. NKZ332]
MNSPVSTPLRRSGAHSRPLREPRQVLTSMMRTNYTYVQNASYNSYPTEYVNSNSNIVFNIKIGGELVAYNEASDIILMNGKIAIEGFRQLWIRIVDCLFDILELISRGIQFTANTTVEYVKPVINMIFKTDNRNFLGEDNVNLLSSEGKNETTKQSPSPEEVNRMIYDAINKLDISAIIQDIVKAHLESNKNTHVDEQFINNHLHILILEVLKK